MNNIYKVIWSKAKNCYVVASEIARSHTKSASGSEKIGGVTRRSLLASLMALSLLCGGLGVAEATVHVNEGTGVTHEVYTTGETYSREVADAKLDLKADKIDVATNTANINNLDGKLSNLTTTVNGKADAAAVTTALDSKADTDLSNLTAAGETKIKNTMSADMDLKANKADVNIALDGKADKATVTDLATKVGDASSGLVKDVATLKTTVGDASSGLVKDVADLKTQGNDLNTAIGNKADQRDLDAAKAKITTNETNITALQTKTTGLSADGKSLNSMNRVETDALKVTGEISNGAGVTTTLAKIDESMKQTETNKGDIANLKSKTDTQQTWIGRLNERTTQISYDPAKGTTVNGVDFMAAEVDAHGKGLTGVTTLNTTGDATIGGALTAAEVNAGTGAITGGSLSVIGAVNGISVNAGTLNTTGDATVGGDLSAKNTEINGTLHATGATTLDGALTAKGEAAFEKNVTMDQKLTVTGDTSLNKTDVNGALTAKGDVILGTNTAQTVTVNGIADFNEAVNMDNGLTVTNGDTTLQNTDVKGALNVSGESNLKNTTVDGTLSVNKETTLNGKLTAKDEATFTKKVTMEDDLEVKGELKTDKIAMENKKTDADGTIHNSTTTITADGITHNGEVKKNGVTTESQFTHTEKGSETYAKRGDATDWTETRSDLTADGVTTEVKDSKGNRTNTSQTKEGINGFAIDKDGNSSTTSQTAKGINGYVTDKDGNKTYTKVTATENSFQVQDKDGKNKNHQVNTKDSSVTEIKNAAGATTKTEQTAENITNTAQNGTITNDAMNIVNNASGNMTNTVGGNLSTTVGGNEIHEVKGTKTETVEGKVTENFKNGQETNVTGNQDIHVTGKQTNKIDGNQENTIGGDQTTNVTGDILNTAKNITNAATETLTDKVGTNTRVINSTSITDSVGATTNRKIEDGKITDTAGDFTVTTEKTKGTTFAKTGSTTAFSTEAGAPTDTNIAGNLITTGRVDANELGVSDKDGANSADFSVEAGEGKGVKASAGNGTTTGSLDVKADEVGSSVKDASGKGSTFKQRIDAIMGNVKTADGESEVTQKGDEITSKVGLGEATNSRVTQKKDMIESAVTDGTNTNDRVDTASASAKKLTDGTRVNKLQDNLDSSEKTITNGTYKTSKLQTALDITNTAKDGTITNDAKNIVNNATGDMTNIVGGKLTTTVTGQATENFKGGLKTDITGEEIHTVTGNQTNKVTGKQTNTVEGGQENIISGGQINNITGDQTTTISGTQTTTATDINRNASSGMIDTIDNDYGTNTETKVAGKTTTDVSIKGTGEEGKYIRGANESRDYLIKGTLKNSETKTVEKTSTEITDGTNKASTIQDAKNLAGSVTNGTETGVSGIHANDDGSVSIDSGVTDGTNTSVQKQTASAIATDVKDGAGNENASVATATTSANTITNGTKANTVISTADGTSFINSEAAAPVTGDSGAGTAVNTTIKGNTITTGKVTMDYAEVMKDLGVHGNAKVDQNLEVGGTSTLKGDVTMESNATVKKDLKVEGTTTTQTLKVTENAEIDGTLKVAKKATFEDSVSIAKDLSVGGDVTANSYKVGDKTYIDANGIHANGQKITDVADGSISEGSKDAVNGGQLYGVKRDLEHQVDKVGANAAAMANLRPMEFDPSSKWNIAAAIGNYGSETAAALGAFYRPNDDVMVNLSTAFGTGENMVGGGVSVRLGKSGNKLSREESNALKAQVDDLTARMDALLSVLNPNMSKDFPDVPENHWAYEAVSRLAGNDIVQGYPDGEFHGERTMTRYEMAEIIYNALSRGAEAERELVEEFKPELQAMAASEKATAEKAEG